MQVFSQVVAIMKTSKQSMMLSLVLFFQAAVTSLPANYAELLDMKQAPVSIIQPMTKSVLKGMRLGIGPESPIENAAIERLKRAGAI